MTPRVPAKANIKQWNEGQQPRESTRVTLQCELALFPLLSRPPPTFFPSGESKTAPAPCCSPRPTAGPVAGVN